MTIRTEQSTTLAGADLGPKDGVHFRELIETVRGVGYRIRQPND